MSHQTSKVIIVEDDREVNSLITAVCRLNGYETYMIFSAEKCLAQIREMQDDVDVVYMNGTIAADKGAMLISKIKQIDINIKILVVANDTSARNIILEYGADDFLIKPVGVETILSKISMLFAC
ncbi:MAG TPA: response regulator [Nitrososphaeraceae archaeon]|jgi:two-component system response regulator ArlR